MFSLLLVDAAVETFRSGARALFAQQLWLFHHKPGRPDGEMREIEAAAQQVFKNTYAAKEGDSFLV